MRRCNVAVGVLLAGCAPPAAVQGGDAATAERAILRLEEAWRAARVAGDTAFLQALYAPELRIQGTNGAVITRDQDIAGFASGSIRPEFIRAEEMRVALYGRDVAVVTGVDHMRGSYGGAQGEGRARFMHVFARRDGRWQLVASQGTWVRGNP